MTQCDACLPQAGVKLADYTTWRVGGSAEWLVEPASLEETKAWIEWAAHQGMPCRVIGAGSNLLIHDDGLPCLLYTSPSPRDVEESRMPSSA